jgi:hypothetical protein
MEFRDFPLLGEVRGLAVEVRSIAQLSWCCSVPVAREVSVASDPAEPEGFMAHHGNNGTPIFFIVTSPPKR